MIERIAINKDIIPWAIERDGKNLDEFFAENQMVYSWYTGERQPTLKQIEQLSKILHVPFGYFFLKQPPVEKLSIPFFRTIDGVSDKVTLPVWDTVNTLIGRQQWLREFLISNAEERLDFVGTASTETPYEDIVSSIRETLGLQENWARFCPNSDAALNMLVDKIELHRIVVTSNGIVGNNTHRKIPVEDCRGFVLVDDMVPFLFVNNNDSKGAQLFTILHELAHIWIGESAVFDMANLMPSNNAIETLCDKVAAEFLVPERDFTDNWKNIGDRIDVHARQYKVSFIVVARRAFDLGFINKNTFFTLYNEYIQSIVKANETSGGNFHATTKKRISASFAHFVDTAVRSNQLLYRDAYRLTGLTGNTYHTFVNNYLS